MKKISLRFLALLLSMALVFGLAACSKNEPASTTEAETTEIETFTDEPTTQEVTTEEAPTQDLTTAVPDDTTTVTTTAPDVTSTTKPGDTSTTATTATTKPASAAPSTKEEIIEYFNAASNKVKTDKPGFTYKDRVLIDKSKVKISNGLLNAIAPTIIGFAESSFSNWTDKGGPAKGANHNNSYPVEGKDWSSKLTPAVVKSAACTDKGSTYEIKIVMNNEKISPLPRDASTTNHGKAFNIMSKADLDDGLQSFEKWGISISKFDLDVSGSTITATVDKASGRVTKATYSLVTMADMTAKVTAFTVDASVPLTFESEYIIAK
ncbi:MAG: hypothetical protein FWF05_04800 [Oscillospiraceae bacterium]|nr:hypothetical protein [Oscillospiraceae bacterium]